jgi:hypothetical protein
MSLSYTQKLQHIQQRYLERTRSAPVNVNEAEKHHQDVLIETFENVSALIHSEEGWLDIPNDQFKMSTTKAPPADRPTDRAVWMCKALMVIMNVFQELLKQNSIVQQIIDQTPITPIDVRQKPAYDTRPRKESSASAQGSNGGLHVATPVSLSRQGHTRKFSEGRRAGDEEPSSRRRPSTPNLRAAQVDDARVDSKESENSGKSFTNTLREKMSNLDIGSKKVEKGGDQLTTEHPEPRQFHKYPTINAPSQRPRAESSGGLTSLLSTSKASTAYDSSNRV